MNSKTFTTDQEFYDQALQSIGALGQSQRDLKAEILRVVEPLARRRERDKIFERFEGNMRGLTGSLIGGPALSLRSACEALLEADPVKRTWLRYAWNCSCRIPKEKWDEAVLALEPSLKVRALTTGDSGLGQALAVFEPLAEDLYVLLQKYSAFRTLGVVPLDAGKKKLASVTGKAAAVWITVANQGTPIPADASITGASISPEVATVGALIEISGEALADGKTTFEGALLAAIVEGLGYRLDFTCFQGDGTDDQANGGQTGIFADANVPSVDASAGKTNVEALHFDDFANLIGGVATSALGYPCRFWIAPAFLPKLLKVKDGSERLLKPPTGPDDEWRIFGWPVTWAGAAPSTNAAAAKVIAFGRPDAYSVALRQDFEIRSSAATAKWAQNLWQMRAIARARCLMRDATSLATLKLAAV
jgi:HK97 family phage major capsid protein